MKKKTWSEKSTNGMMHKMLVEHYILYLEEHKDVNTKWLTLARFISWFLEKYENDLPWGSMFDFMKRFDRKNPCDYMNPDIIDHKQKEVHRLRRLRHKDDNNIYSN